MIFVCSEFSSLGFDASLGVVTKKRRNSHFFQGRTPLPSPNHRPSALSLSLSLSQKGLRPSRVARASLSA